MPDGGNLCLTCHVHVHRPSDGVSVHACCGGNSSCKRVRQVQRSPATVAVPVRGSYLLL
jgi:hypothetical protein